MTGVALLDDVRVLDLAGDATAHAGRMLADLGADVLLVEAPRDSPARRRPPLATTPSGDVVSAHFAYTAAGKRSVTIDLGVPRGRSLFLRLVGASDVLLTDAAVGEMDALGLGYEAVHALHPGLVYTSLTPFGLTGPRRRWRGSDLVGWATSGAMPSIGDADRAPLAPGGELAYTAGALNAAMGTVAALMARDATGSGQLVDISVQEATMSVAMEVSPMVVLEGGFEQRRTGRRKEGGPLGHYATCDGAVSIVAYMPEHWRILAEWVHEETGVEEILAEEFAGTPVTRSPYAELIDLWIEGLTTRYTKQAFFEEAQRRGITVAPVNSASDVLDDVHLRATGGWAAYEGDGVGMLHVPTPPFHVDGSTATVGDVPALGAHNRDVLVGLLGLGDDEVDALHTDGVI
jgi:crotonobetainyl-CoA:carnitine CoA-transferase CaiB-like acyl-CoA transferase